MKIKQLAIILFFSLFLVACKAKIDTEKEYFNHGESKIIYISDQDYLKNLEYNDISKMRKILDEIILPKEDNKNKILENQEEIRYGISESFKFESENSVYLDKSFSESGSIKFSSNDNKHFIIETSDEMNKSFLVLKKDVLYQVIFQINNNVIIISPHYLENSEEYSIGKATYESIEQSSIQESIEISESESIAESVSESESESISESEEISIEESQEARKNKKITPTDYKKYDYKEISRDKSGKMFEKIQFSGTIIQVIEDDKGESTQYRIASNTNGYDDVYLVEIDNILLDKRLLEDDYVTVYGYSIGIISYESTQGATISIPGVYADKIELQ